MKPFLIILSAALFILSCKNQSSSKWATIKFIQDKPSLVHLKWEEPRPGYGDGMAFEALIKDTAGNNVGEVLGWLVTVDLMDGDSANPVFETDRIGTIIFNLGDDNEIIAQGGTSYKMGEQQMNNGLPQKRAIIGGTGKYKGISGEVTTTRNEDGTYTHVLDVIINQ